MGRPWLVLAGGGTGGHLYPGLAVADALRRMRPDFDVSVFGTTRPIDREVVTPRGYELVEQEVQPFPSRPWQWPGFLMTWRRAVAAARARFVARRPAVVLGLGGYAAAPGVVAADRMGVATALFNPDAEPGRANRRLGRHARRVFVQWPVTATAFNGCGATIEVTGCPVRGPVVAARREDGLAAFGLNAEKPTLLITGASQGARSINWACLKMVDVWKASGWQIVQVTGTPDFVAVRDGYREAGVDARVVAFTEKMPEALAAADLVISRAGASTLAELTARGVASVLIPYPYDRKQHQVANARVLVEAGAAVLVDDRREAEANAVALRGALWELMSSNERRGRMAVAAKSLGRRDAAERIAERLLEAAGPAS